MADIFQQNLKLIVPESIDLWSLGAAFTERIQIALQAVHGEIVPYTITVSAPGGSRFQRDTLQEARYALEANDLEAHHVFFRLKAKSSNAMDSESFASVEVSLWPDVEGISNFDVVISADSKVICDGLVAATNTFYERWKSGGSNPVTPASTPTLIPTSTPDLSPAASWIARTWRDHMAALIVAIGGGIGSGIFVIWWSGSHR